ncbi:MAG TPA: class I SAM-dependent methyltransferase, partial [Terriglobales bacterium]|nr:class I SAM-dependent methyltransferase [Terriglobales bacterium]
ERLFNAFNAHAQTAAIKTAVELEIFTAIAEGKTSASAVAQRCNIAERGARILCDFLTIHGFLTKTGANYGLAPDSALFLDRHSPSYVGSAIDFMLSQRVMEAHARLTDAVRSGRSALGEAALEPENPIWVRFAEAMAPLTMMPAQGAAAELRRSGEFHKVLDIAAGHGIYGIAVAQQNPKAQVYAADWNNVLAVAQRNAQRAGVADRYHLLPGSAFESDFGHDYDLVLIPNFLHHFDLPTCTRFLNKVHGALAADGRAAVIEFVPNTDRVTPPAAAGFSLTMLAMTPSGDAYTFAELEKMAKDAGFSRVEISPVELGVNRLVVAYH